MDRREAMKWLHEQLRGNEAAAILVYGLGQAWETADKLSEHLLPESVMALLLARPTAQQPEASEEPTFTLTGITLGELFEMISACAWYDTELRKRGGESSAIEKAAIAALEKLHQRLLTVTMQPPPHNNQD
jgi:hypothetical protein